MTRVKVCGLTRAQDVRLAVELGVWACGFVLTPGPRRVSAARARELRDAAPTHGSRVVTRASAQTRSAPLTVAVVTTESADAIASALAESGCEAVQLSAGADGAGVEDVRAAARARGLRPLVVAAADTLGADDADLLLLDARRPGRYGGTGERADWAAAARLATSRPLVLAGGLTPDSVAEAVATVRPYALDVSSGVETAPGFKDEGLLRAFVAAAAAADADIPEASS